MLQGPVWVAWPYTGLCGQSQGLKNRLRAEADIDNQGRDGAGREHAGKKAQCFLRTGMWIKLTLHLRSASYCSSPFICLTLHSAISCFTIPCIHFKNQDPHYSKFCLCKTLEYESIAKCPWPSKKCTNIIYIHISSSSKSPTFHCQMLFFTAGLPDEWRYIFHQWATFYRVKKKKAPNTFTAF